MLIEFSVKNYRSFRDEAVLLKGVVKCDSLCFLWVFIIFGVIPYENWWFTNLCKYP